MKIDRIGDIKPIVSQGRSATSGKTDVPFKDVLDETVKGHKPTEKPVVCSSIQPSLSSMPVSPVVFGRPDIALQRTEDLMGLLSQFRDQLANPAVTLKEIAPLVDEMERNQLHLKGVADSIGKEEGLKPIVDEILVVAAKEILRFRGGEYS
jgi:hypothetical protein